MLVRTFVFGCCQGALLLMALFSLAGAAEAQKETPAPEVAPAEVLKYFAGDWKGTGEVVGFAEWSFTAKMEQEANGNCILERRHLEGADFTADQVALTCWYPASAFFRELGAGSGGWRWTATSSAAKSGAFFVLRGQGEGSTDTGVATAEKQWLRVLDKDHFVAYSWDRKTGDSTVFDTIVTYTRQDAEGAVDAAAIVRKMLGEMLEKDPGNVAALRGRGMLLAALGEYEAAAKDLAGVLALAPEDHWTWYVLSPILRTLNREAYLAHCTRMRERFDPADPVVYGRALQACLLDGNSVKDWQQLAKEAEDVFLRSPVRMKNSRSAMVGLARYRSGEFKEATQWLGWACEAQQDTPEAVKSLLTLAAARAKLGEKDEANKALKLGTEMLERTFPVRRDGRGRLRWHDWLISSLIRQEAENLLANK